MINYIFIVVGIFLRQFNIESDFYFTGELGKELIFSKYLIDSGTIPTIGMATSHEWLYYGPIYYWILTPLLKVFSFNPYTLFWLAFAVSIVGLVANYKVIKKIANQKVAIYSTVLISLSPLFIWQTRLSKLHVYLFLLTPILIYMMKLVWNGKQRFVFWLGLVFGIFFSFHFSQIPLIIVILAVLLIKKFKIKDYFLLLSGILIPNFGIIIKDLKILLWLPYRSFGLSSESSSQTLESFNNFFGMQFFWDQKLWFLGSAFSIFILIVFYKKYIESVNNNFFNFYLIFSSLVVFGGLILHKNPPIHYFLPIFPNVFYMLSILMDKYFSNKQVIFIFLVFSIINIWRYEMPTDIDYVSYKKQLEISQKIVEENKGNSIKIKRVGPYDYFPENYSQNYKFLIWYLGGKIDDNSDNVVIIDDNENINTK